MAWRPYENLIAGELDNTTPGKVTGWIDFYRKGRKPLHVAFDLKGDFHEDIRGRKIHVFNDNPSDRYDNPKSKLSYIDGLSTHQKGEVGDITAGKKVNGKCPYVDYPYIEWYSDRNGRVVLELDTSQIEIIKSNARPELLTDEQIRKAEIKRKMAMAGFLKNMAESFAKHGKKPVAVVVGSKNN